MTPITSIIYKEYRQQRPLAWGMLLLCLTFLIISCIGITISSDEGWQQNTDTFLGIALFTTALFAGAAAAISFSGEHEDKTFNFLRSLPVSSGSVMLGKTIWLITGTIGVLVCSLIFSLIFGLMFSTYSDTGNVVGTFGVGIIEALVWGLFWSPRCRSQVFAILSTYFCASATSFIAVNSLNANPAYQLEGYCAVIPLRFGICSVVFLSSIWGMLRWFDNAVQKRGKGKSFTLENFAFFRYPQETLSPFYALCRQSFLQSQTLLLCGIGVAFFVCLYFCFASLTFDSEVFRRADSILYTYLLGGGWFLMVGCSTIFYTIFCACIFGQDQKNDSFRFLSRSGISPGLVWWSRVLPFFTITVPVFIVAVPCLFFTFRESMFYNNQLDWHLAYFYFGLTCSCWLVPLAVGAYISISVRSVMVAIALTGVGTGLLMSGWLGISWLLFRFNPLWTTLPICIALLVASRLRTVDWLREKRTWRSRFYPLVPVFAVCIAILAVIPPIRVYSIPLISLAQIEAELNQTHLPKEVCLSTEERNTLFREMETRLPLPLTKEELTTLQQGDVWHVQFRIRETLIPKNFDSLPLMEQCKIKIKKAEASIVSMPPFEMILIKDYELMHRAVNSGYRSSRGSPGEKPVRFYTMLPWEKARALRMGHLLLFSTLKRIGENGYSRNHHFDSYHAGKTGVIDQIILGIVTPWDTEYYLDQQIRFRMEYVTTALECWYLEHNNTLPKSLDELVGGYIKAVPTDPLTGEPMQYEPNRNETLRSNKKGYTHDSFGYQYKPGWQHIELGGRINDLRFLPGYKEYETKEN